MRSSIVSVVLAFTSLAMARRTSPKARQLLSSSEATMPQNPFSSPSPITRALSVPSVMSGTGGFDIPAQQARLGLEAYCQVVKASLQSGDLNGKIEAEDKSKIEKAVQDTLDWTAAHQSATKGDYEAKQIELEGIVSPILKKYAEVPSELPADQAKGRLTLLEAYIQLAKSVVESPEMKEKMDTADRSKAETVLQETLDWTVAHPQAAEMEYEAKQLELEGQLNPILKKYGKGPIVLHDGTPDEPSETPSDLPKAPEQGVLYRCETLKTYDPEVAKKSCANNKVPFACFSLYHHELWQCFDDQSWADEAECVKIFTPDGTSYYDGACVYAMDFRWTSAKDGSGFGTQTTSTTTTTTTTTTTVTTTSTSTKGSARGQSVAGLSLFVIVSAAAMWHCQ